MSLFKLLLFTLTFYELVVKSDAGEHKCPKGKRVVVNHGRAGCEDCHVGTFQVGENDSTRCKGACRRCDINSGSTTKKECTKESNAECECRSGFVPSDDDSTTCKCDIGNGLSIKNGRKECSKCEHGYFNTKPNSPCRQWKECKPAGVKTPGTTKSDVICSNTSATTQPTSTKIISIITRLTPHRPQEGTENQQMRSTTTATTSSASGHTVAPKVNVTPSYPSSPGNYIGMALLIFGICGLLVLTAVTCKLHITPYLEKQPAEPRNESCRRPVEESGDGSLSPLKQNAEEP